ncbi:hypothetical protein [Mycobacteroides abscessus]|uniref:hypothetical protein n=1 Tax=Mycobacteroides abscessus TaxID=36809 RepID=UPI0019CF5B1B|nr:hypothetical protein [Mycobacteroides abscessus]
MSGPTKSVILGIDANSYRPQLDAVHAMATKYEQHISTFKGYVDKPGGTAWEGQTAEAGQRNAADGWKVTARIQDIDTKFQTTAGLAVDHTIVPELTNCQHMIENIERQRDKGLTLSEDLEVGYNPPPGISEELAAENAKVAKARGEELRESARKWWEAEQEVKRLAEGAVRDIENEVNGAAGTFDIGKAVKDTAPRKPDTAQDANFYKQWYPKESSPASTQAAAATAVDPNAPVLGPPSPGDKPFQPDPRAGGLTDKLGVMGITEPKSPLDKPPSPPDARTVPAPKLDPNTPQGKAAIDKFRGILATQYPPDQVEAKLSEAIKGAQQDRPMVATPEPGTPERVRQSGGEAFAESWDQAGRAKDDLLGINGGDHAKEAWKGVAKGLWDVVNPDPVHQVERGIDQAKGAIDEVKSGIDNPKAFIGKHGIEIAAGIATAPVGGEGALLGTEGRALTHGLEDAAPGHASSPHTAEPHTSGHAPTEPPSGTTHPAPTVDHPTPAADHPGGDHGIPANIEHAAGLPRSADDILNDSRAAHRLERDQLDWARGEQNLADLAAHHGVPVDELPRTPQYDIHHPTYTDKIAADHGAEIDRHTQMWEHGYNTQSVQQVLDNMDAPRLPTTDLRDELRRGLADYGAEDLMDAGYSPSEAKRLAREYADTQFPSGSGLIPQPVIHNPDGAGGGYRQAFTYGDWQVNNALGNLTKQEKDALRNWLETQDPNAIVNIRLGRE